MKNIAAVSSWYTLLILSISKTTTVAPMEQSVTKELLEAGRGYEALFVPALFGVWPKHLVKDLTAGSHVVDVACGTGVLARSALAKTGAGGRVVGADPAPGMLAVAKEIEPAIEWVMCAAEALDFGDEEFDCVLSQFGMMFFDDRKRSTEEIYRVLKPGGSLAIAVWRSVDHNPAYADLISVLEEQVGADAANALRLPYNLGIADEVVEILEAAGFGEVKIEVKTETAKFPTLRHMVEAELRGWLPLFDIFIGENKISQILIGAEKALGKYVGTAGEAVFPTSAHVFTAQKV